MPPSPAPACDSWKSGSYASGIPSPSESEYSPSFGSVGNESTLSALPSPSVSALFGFVPIWYSCALVRPSLSESALPSPPLVGLRPLATSHPSGRPSPSLSALFMFVPSACSSALVRPSPSQSAPPSLGSRGSDPSPLTAEAADRARRKAKSMLIVFVFVFVFIFSLPFLLCLHREPAVLSFRIKGIEICTLDLGRGAELALCTF